MSLRRAMMYSLGVTASPYHPYVAAFLAANPGVTNVAEKVALNQYCLDLIGFGLIDGTTISNSIIKVLYPNRGGTATTCKYNFMNPADTDGAFRATYFGGNTFSINGRQPDGISGYLDSHFIPNTSASINGFSFFLYSRTNDTSGTQISGCSDSFTPIVQVNMCGANIYVGGNVGSGYIIYTATPSTRTIIGRRSANNNMEGLRDSVSLGTNTGTEVGVPSFAFTFSGRNDSGVVGGYASHEHAVEGLALGMTHQNALDFTTATDAFVLALGINV